MGNRRTLSGSRNRLFSTAVGYEENTVTERVTVTVAPTIDIDEPNFAQACKNRSQK